jgi:zinc transport system substrate-binding protein
VRLVRGVSASAAALLLLAGLSTGCRSGMEGGAASEKNDGLLRVAVSVPPQAWLVERIGGARVRTEVMIPPGYSHVDVPLTPRQMTALGRAVLYVKVGHPAFELETEQLAPVLASLPGLRIVDMSRGMRLLDGTQEHAPGHGADPHGHQGGDPHVWVAPGTFAVAAANVARALEEADPAHAAEYRANLRGTLAEIRAVDQDIRRQLAETPAPRRKFMVYHPTWGYFARQYGLEQIAIEFEGKEPSAVRLIHLIEEARQERVKVIFVESGFPRESAQIIAEAVGGRVVTADPQDKDWPGNLRRTAAELREAWTHV